MKTLVIAAVAAIASTTSALAADVTIKAAPIVPVKVAVLNWSGIYVGMHGGGQWSRITVENPSSPGNGISPSYSSLVLGAHAGIQHQFGGIVLGVEGNYTNASGNSGSEFCGSTPVLTPGGNSECSARLNNFWTVGPRLGLVHGAWLPYVAGGYANASYRFRANAPGGGPVVEQADARLNGWFVGVGMGFALHGGWSVGVDYAHLAFNPKTVNATSAGGSVLEPARFDATTDTFTMRLDYRFGGHG